MQPSDRASGCTTRISRCHARRSSQQWAAVFAARHMLRRCINRGVSDPGVRPRGCSHARLGVAHAPIALLAKCVEIRQQISLDQRCRSKGDSRAKADAIRSVRTAGSPPVPCRCCAQFRARTLTADQHDDDADRRHLVAAVAAHHCRRDRDRYQRGSNHCRD